MSKPRASCFIGDSKHLETVKRLRLRRRAFICFSVLEPLMKHEARVFEILLENPLKG